MVPPDQIQNVIKHFHTKTAKHHGWNRTYKLIRTEHVGVMEHVVREFINNCETCLKFESVKYDFYIYIYIFIVFILNIFITFLVLVFIIYLLGRNLG